MRCSLLTSLLLLGVSCAEPPSAATPRAGSAGTAAAVATAGRYPAAPNSGLVYDLFGAKVSDPYRPLEDLDAPATRAWIEAENALTDRALAASPSLPAFRAKLTRLLDIESNGAPQVKAGKWFWLYDDGKAPQASLVMATSEA